MGRWGFRAGPCQCRKSLKYLLAPFYLAQARCTGLQHAKLASKLPICCPGWSTGLVLENVRLKVEAFEYLQLPFNIKEGSIGRLEIQVLLTMSHAHPGMHVHPAIYI